MGYQNYRGLKLAVQRRSASGLSLNANYTLSRCMGTPTATTFNQASAGYLKPEDPSFDAGYCDQDRKHLSSVTLGYETPEVANAVVRAVASHWRLSGNLTTRSGDRLNTLSGQGNAFTGIGNQRPNYFNWGNPIVNFNAGFGQITTQSGDPRVMQFGIKYDF